MEYCRPMVPCLRGAAPVDGGCDEGQIKSLFHNEPNVAEPTHKLRGGFNWQYICMCVRVSIIFAFETESSAHNSYYHGLDGTVCDREPIACSSSTITIVYTVSVWSAHTMAIPIEYIP